jgi:hypothetical protein
MGRLQMPKYQRMRVALGPSTARPDIGTKNDTQPHNRSQGELLDVGTRFEICPPTWGLQLRVRVSSQFFELRV